jgi:hypothetical protein
MLKAIDNAVVYHVVNPMRADGLGVSCYFPFTGKQENFEKYAKLNVSSAFGYYYDYSFSGSLSKEGQDYLASFTTLTTPVVPEPEPLPNPSDLGLDDHDIYLEDDIYILQLGDKARYVSSIYYLVGVYDEASQDFILFGARDDIFKDWDNGTFYGFFMYTWGALDGALCYMEAVSQTEDSILYSVPVYHNGTEKELMVAFNKDDPDIFFEGTYEILGIVATNSIADGPPDPTFEKLKVGDVVEPILYRYTAKSNYYTMLSGPGEPMTRAITVTSNTSFDEEYLDYGMYLTSFVMTDYTGDAHISKYGFYYYDNRGITPVSQ